MAFAPATERTEMDTHRSRPGVAGGRDGVGPGCHVGLTGHYDAECRRTVGGGTRRADPGLPSGRAYDGRVQRPPAPNRRGPCVAGSVGGPRDGDGVHPSRCDGPQKTEPVAPRPGPAAATGRVAARLGVGGLRAGPGPPSRSGRLPPAPAVPGGPARDCPPRGPAGDPVLTPGPPWSDGRTSFRHGIERGDIASPTSFRSSVGGLPLERATPPCPPPVRARRRASQSPSGFNRSALPSKANSSRSVIRNVLRSGPSRGRQDGDRTIEVRLPSMARWNTSATIRPPTVPSRPSLNSASRRT